MAGEIKSSDVIEQDIFRNAIESSKQLDESLKNNIQSFNKILEVSSKGLKDNNLTSAKDVEELAKAQEKVKKTTEQLSQAEKARAELAKESERLKTRLIKAESEQGRELEGLRQKVNAVNKANREQAKAAMQTFDAYDTLNKEFRKAQRELKGLAAQYGVNSKEVKNALINFNNLDKRMRAVNKTAKDARMFVGEYERGNWGLSNSINQLTREVPAFANSMQTGFMAISNNLPIFYDELVRIKKINADLISQGKPVKSAFSQIAGAFFSLQTAMSLGVTLLTIFGPELVDVTKSMLGFKDEIKATAKAEEEATKKTEALRKEIEKLKGVYESRTPDNIASSIKAGADISKVSISEIEKALSEFKKRRKEFTEEAFFILGEESIQEKTKEIKELTFEELKRKKSIFQTTQEIRDSKKAISDENQAKFDSLDLNKKIDSETSDFESRRKKAADEELEFINSTIAALEKILKKEKQVNKEANELKKLNMQREADFSEFISKNLAIRELELRRQGATEDEIAEKVTMHKIELMLLEITTRKKFNQDTVYLELELQRELDALRQKNQNVKDKANESELSKRHEQVKASNDAFVKGLKKEVIENKKANLEKARQNEQLIQSQIRALSDASGAKSRIRQAEINSEIAEVNQNITRQEQLQQKGLSNELAFQQKRAAELEQERRREAEQEEKRQKVLAYFNLVAEYAKTDPNSAPVKAAVQIAAAEVISGFFHDGTEQINDNTATKWRSTGKDDYLVAVDGGERVVPTELNKGLDGISNEKLANLGYLYKKGQISAMGKANSNTTVNNFETTEINKRLESLENTVRESKTTVSLDGLGVLIESKVANGLKKQTRRRL